MTCELSRHFTTVTSIFTTMTGAGDNPSSSKIHKGPH